MTAYVPILVAVTESGLKNSIENTSFILLGQYFRKRVPQDLTNREDGLPEDIFHQRRWSTIANRIFRFYVLSAEPSEGLKLLGNYVRKVYMPEFKTIVHVVFYQNSYFAYSDILLMTLNDE